ncbi:3-demethylubiquinone-9 3-methyltransferase [Alteromonadaceae bacterium 2753L.S.0a.02]|nr:3-demethylubiquinone-9 3-methyltransferase [Alteromonadaceae bacterium 2753L.S.0a.02]
MTTETLEHPRDTTNVDAAEIAKFERMASRWWDSNGEFKPLHDINPLRANFIDEHANVAEKQVLDIGCGGGILCEALWQRGAQVTGIDMGEAPLEVAKLHALESGAQVNYLQTTAEDHAQSKSGHYDVVTCLEMLEHVPNPASTIRASAKLLKDDGDIFFSTINRNPKSYAFAILGAEYLLKLLPKGTHEYGKFIRPSELTAWLREAGLMAKHIIGISYNPVTKHYRLNPNDVDVNYIIHAKKS